MRNSLVFLGLALSLFASAGRGQNLTWNAFQAFLPSPSGAVQAASATLTGTVKDSTGALIPGAKITVHGESGPDKTAIADSAGKFSISGLSAGVNTISITSEGFEDFPKQTVTLAAGESKTLDAELHPLAVTSNVTVQAGGPMQIETQNAEVSGTLTQKEIVSFGLNGRNFSSLITLAPGVSNQTGQDEAKVGVVGSAKFSVNGGRTEYNTFDVDGIDVLNSDIGASHGHSTLLVYPSVDSIQEVKVLTSNYGAEYGRSASGTVLVSLSSGGDKFHGNAYEFIRNEFFNDRNYFDSPGNAPLYRRNDFGFTIGGPFSIPHVYEPKTNKSYFFISEEWRKERTPVEFNQGVPTDAERGYNLATQSYGPIANFSDVCPTSNGATKNFSTAAYPDCPGQGFGGTKSTFPYNQFYIDPNAQTLLQDGIIPRANATRGCNSTIGTCYVASVSPSTDYREDLGKFDQQLTGNTKLTLSLIHDHWKTVTAIPWWSNNVNSFPSVMNSFLGPGYAGIAHIVTVINPTMLNDFSVSGTWQKVSLENVPGAGVNLNRQSLYNVPDPFGSFFQNCFGGEFGPNNSCIGGKLPGIVIGGTNGEYGGNGFNIDTSYMPWFSSRGVGTITDGMSKYFSKHSLQFGVQFIYARRHEFGAQNGANSGDVQGLLTFRNISNLNTTGNAFADFLYNNSNPVYSPISGGQNVYSFQQDNTQVTYKVGYWTLEPFFQDDIKVTPRLTVNLGIRLSLYSDWKPENGQTLYNWDPTAFNPALASSSNISVNPLRGYLQNATTSAPLPINITNLNPVLTNGLVQCGANGVPSSCQSTHLFNPSPRIGFAWDPTGSGKTSIRAGYGVFFEHGTGSEGNVGSLMGNPPQVLSMTEEYPANYASLAAVGVPGTPQYTQIETPLNMISIPSKTIWPYVQQWSFGVQHELVRSTAVTAAYVGSKGTHLAVAEQINQLPPVPGGSNPFGPHEPITQDLCLANQINPNDLQDPNGYFYFPDSGQYLYYATNPTAFTALVAACNGTQGTNGHPSIAYGLNYLRPDQGVGNIIALRNLGNSSYNSGQLTIHHTHQFAPGDSWVNQLVEPSDIALVYTYSHSIDESSDRFQSNFIDSYDLGANRASSDFDQRQLLNVSYIFQLPLLHTRSLFFHATHWTYKDPKYAAHPDTAPTTEKVVYPEYGGPSNRTRMLLDNWSLTGITLFQSGTPFSVVNGASNDGISVLDNAGLALGENADSYPDVATSQTGPCDTSSETSLNGTTEGPVLRNPCKFVAPRGLTQGNAGRNYLNNPSRNNWDMALLKDFKFDWHNSNLQFRAEAFNVFNQTQFILFDPIRGNTAANTVNCYDTAAPYSAACSSSSGFLRPIEAHRPRTIQFGLKFNY